jgi:hypothetical protein
MLSVRKRLSRYDVVSRLFVDDFQMVASYARSISVTGVKGQINMSRVLLCSD